MGADQPAEVVDDAPKHLVVLFFSLEFSTESVPHNL